MKMMQIHKVEAEEIIIVIRIQAFAGAYNGLESVGWIQQECGGLQINKMEDERTLEMNLALIVVYPIWVLDDSSRYNNIVWAVVHDWKLFM